jgi:hypothetical protein
VNSPKPRLANAAWSVFDFGTGGGNAYGGLTYGNVVEFGNPLSTANAITAAENPLMKPEDAWNIDSKLDDGLPASGKVMVRMWGNNCTTSVSATDYTGQYKLSYSAIACSLVFPQSF